MLSDAIRRNRLCKKIVKLVAPEGMSQNAYEIACAASGFVPALDNGMYLHWIIVEGANEHKRNSKAYDVFKLLADGLKKGYLLDPNNNEQLEYFADAIHESLLMFDSQVREMLFEAFFTGYKGQELNGIYQYIKRLNKAFGFTSVEYFS